MSIEAVFQCHQKEIKLTIYKQTNYKLVFCEGFHIRFHFPLTSLLLHRNAQFSDFYGILLKIYSQWWLLRFVTFLLLHTMVESWWNNVARLRIWFWFCLARQRLELYVSWLSQSQAKITLEIRGWVLTTNTVIILSSINKITVTFTLHFTNTLNLHHCRCLSYLLKYKCHITFNILNIIYV